MKVLLFFLFLNISLFAQTYDTLFVFVEHEGKNYCYYAVGQETAEQFVEATFDTDSPSFSVSYEEHKAFTSKLRALESDKARPVKGYERKVWEWDSTYCKELSALKD